MLITWCGFSTLWLNCGSYVWFLWYSPNMISNGYIFRVTSHLWGNSPVTGEFLAQRPVTRSFDAFFDTRMNTLLSKQSWGWWFKTPSRPLWRNCNVVDESRQISWLFGKYKAITKSRKIVSFDNNWDQVFIWLPPAKFLRWGIYLEIPMPDHYERNSGKF